MNRMNWCTLEEVMHKVNPFEGQYIRRAWWPKSTPFLIMDYSSLTLTEDDLTAKDWVVEKMC